ncbi:hypothetical protein [Panacagrimonas sp.]|uniref:hypothetical protein n=1 Tax=Panacagrimonas sp. TaxID=2480088 RepID=UPI003B52E440
MSDPNTPDEILQAFAAEPAHDQETLDRYVVRYPELATDFIDLVLDLRISAAVSPTPVERESPESLAASFARLMASDAPEGVSDLFEPYKGQAFVKLAKTLDIPRALLTPLRDRLVIHTSVPTGFLDRLALAMQETPARLRSYLMLSPASSGALSFKAKGQPGEVEQVSFSQLVNDTEMDEEQRSKLRDELQSDGRQ